MPTLGETCLRLGITRRTLAKWLERVNALRAETGEPPIEPHRDAYDYRYYTLTDEQVEAIRAARSQMPGMSATIPLPPTLSRPRQRPVVSGDDRRVSELPDGLVSVAGWLGRHGLVEEHRVTWTKAMQAGKLPVVVYPDEGPGWRVGETHVRYALDAPGRRAAWLRWHTREWWQPCDGCASGHAETLPFTTRGTNT